jgi:hypothetical protein
MARERGIQTRIVERLTAEGYWVFNVPASSATPRGIPDLLVCVHGAFVALEVKRDRKARLSPMQDWTRDRIRRRGGRCEVVTTVQEAVDVCGEESMKIQNQWVSL